MTIRKWKPDPHLLVSTFDTLAERRLKMSKVNTREAIKRMRRMALMIQK